MTTLMAGRQGADDSPMTMTSGSGPRARARRPGVAIVVALVLLAGRSPAAADEVPPTTSTTSTTSQTTSTTMAPAPSTTAVAPSTTTTTSPAEGWRQVIEADKGNELPPASAGTLPPEVPVVLPPGTPPPPPPPPPPGADDAGLVRARAEVRAAEVALRRAELDEARAAKAVLPANRQAAAARARLAALEVDDDAVGTALAKARTSVKRIAVAGYVRGGNSQPVDYLLRAQDPIDLERRRTIIETATEARHDAVTALNTLESVTSSRVRDAVIAVEDAEATLRPLEAELVSAQAISALLRADVDDKRALLDHASASQPVLGTDIPRLVADAYRSAARTMERRAPNCRVSASVIAGIGKIESNHGRYAGATFALNGDIYPRILGIPLDGTRSALITDTDAGVYDGDLVFDRAVGPMQFIPSTWSRIFEDGNGDGTRDPNNIYDAALGTAAYLCRAVPTGGLDTVEALRTAVFSYNHSTAYVDAVIGWATGYSTAGLV